MPKLLSDFCLILVMGPAELGLREACPETELLGLSVFCVDVLGLNEVILCDTPGASVNCSRSSTLVRPLELFLLEALDFLDSVSNLTSST